MNAYFYDIEITANYASFEFLSMKGEKRTYEVYEDVNMIEMLIHFINDPSVQILMSYNGTDYDDLILQWVRQNRLALRDTRKANIKLKAINDKIISEIYGFDIKYKIRSSMWRAPLPFISIDLQRIHNLKNVSLKRIMIILKMPNVIEYDTPDITINDEPRVKKLIALYPTDKLEGLLVMQGHQFVREYNKLHHFDKLVLPENVDFMRKYNQNDVIALERLYQKSIGEINLRLGMAEAFDFPIHKLISLSRSAAGEKLLIKFYQESSKESPKVFTKKSTMSEPFKLSEVIDPKIEFVTEDLKKAYETIKNSTVTETDNHEITILFDNTVYDIKSGGLHSKDSPGVFYSTVNLKLRDADVGSYYPAIMINLLVSPRHLTAESFIKMLEKVMGKRLDVKHEYFDLLKKGIKDKNLKTISDGLKIAINAIYGKLGEAGRWLYDIKAKYTVTINGQLYLMKLIEMLYMEGIHTISANTDGIVCEIPKELEDTYYRVCKEWEKLFDFGLEYTDYDIYARLDVNNYMSVIDKDKGDEPGNVKTKGGFSQEIELNKGYKHPIVPKVIYDYILFGKDVEESLYAADDIMDFLISVNVGKQFEMKTVNRHTGIIKKEQRINRYYASTGFNELYKYYVNPAPNAKGILIERISVLKTSGVQILNNVTDRNPKNYDINYRFYLKVIRTVIRKTENVQTTLKLF